MAKLTAEAAKSVRPVGLLVVALAIYATGCDTSKLPRIGATSTPRPSVTAPGVQVPKEAFEMRLSFDDAGREVSRKCVVMVPGSDNTEGKYKVWKQNPIACPTSVVVTVGTRDDPLGLFEPSPAPSHSLPQLVTLEKAAEILAVSRTTMQEKVDSGEIPIVPVTERAVRVDVRDLEAYIKAIRRRR